MLESGKTNVLAEKAFAGKMLVSISTAHEGDLEQGFIRGNLKHEEWKRVGLVSVTTGCLEQLEHHKSESMLALSS
jgi:hypothetical protein